MRPDVRNTCFAPAALQAHHTFGFLPFSSLPMLLLRVPLQTRAGFKSPQQTRKDTCRFKVLKRSFHANTSAMLWM
nr:uncharacterized protein colec12 [Nothobranchius furzeri]